MYVHERPYNYAQPKGDGQMNRIRDENFYTVLGWMLNVLQLKGNELIFFAIIYSFSQDGKIEFTGSMRYLQSFANIKSQQTVITTLNGLVTQNYILKRSYFDGKVPRVAYKANLQTIEQKKKGLFEVKPQNEPL